MEQKKLWEEFFRLYNEGLIDEYEKVMENLSDESKFNNPEAFTQIKRKVFDNIDAWYDIKFEELLNKTPKETIDAIKTTDEAAEILLMSFERCDDEIPQKLKEKYESFGEEAIEQLEKTAFDADWEAKPGEKEPDFSIIKSNNALKLLGEFKSVSSACEILMKFCDTNIPDEFIADAVKEYFISLGEGGIPALLDILNSVCENDKTFKQPFEHLLIALTFTGRMNRIDEIYVCIRNCFKKVPEKLIPVICIGDYGDPRGIPLIKGYLDKNLETIDRITFYEALSSIKRLGGQTDDISDPFGDFS